MPEYADDAAPENTAPRISIKIAADETRPLNLPRSKSLARVTRPDFEAMMLSSRERLSALMPEGAELDITDPNFIRNLNQRDFIETDAAANVMLMLVLFGQKSVERSVADPETGEVQIETVLVPDDDMRVKAGKLYVQLQTLKLLQTKQATNIVSVQVSELDDQKKQEALAELAEWRKRARAEITQSQVTTPALPEAVAPNTIFEGELSAVEARPTP